MFDIKIMAVYHKKAFLIEFGDFLPINAGRALAKGSQADWLKENTVGDDTGDNISEKNRMYNEMTAVYWAWKNLEADYYGLTHYRRNFVFSGGDKNYYSVKKSGKKFIEKMGYSPELLRNILSKYDFIAPKPIKEKSVYEHYKEAHDISDFDYAIKLIYQEFPQFSEACKRYIYGNNSYFYNMFVFDKATFNRYCDFMFGILKKTEKRFVGKRMFLSERLTGIFIEQLILEGKSGAFLPTVYIEERIKFSDTVTLTKKNLAERKNKGLMSLIYAFKPIISFFLPSFFFRAYKNRK